MKENLYDEKKNELLRSHREGPSKIRGFASDYAFLISGLLDLYQADFDIEWLRWARQLQDTLDLHFWDQTNGRLLLYLGQGPGNPPAPQRGLRRGGADAEFGRRAEPLAPGAALPQPGAYRSRPPRRARALLAAGSAAVCDAAAAGRGVGARCAAGASRHPLAGPGALGLQPLLAEACRRYLPQLVVILIADDAAREYFAPRHPVIENLPKTVTEPTAYLCENFSCQLPSPRRRICARRSRRCKVGRRCPSGGARRIRVFSNALDIENFRLSCPRVIAVDLRARGAATGAPAAKARISTSPSPGGRRLPLQFVVAAVGPWPPA